MKRRSLLTNAAKTMLALASPAAAMVGDSYARSNNSQLITVFLCGDVMTGRGIDQILPHPSDPRIYEPYMRSAQGYLSLAERRSGPLTKPVDFAYIWGDALEVLDRLRPDVRIVNLETSVTKSENWVPKGINYRMNPDNVVHGHSSHHPKGIEVYNEKPILYGCGDFLNDYEGISGHEEFRSELVLMYLISVDPSGEKLVRFEIMPLEIKRFRLNKVIREDAEWLRNTLDREYKKLGTRVELNADNSMKLRY